MLTRLIGGNRVITLGTAIEQHFLTTQNWGMGATIGVVLIVLSQIIYHSKPIDAKEKMFIPGVCLFLVGLLSLIGHFVNGYV